MALLFFLGILVAAFAGFAVLMAILSALFWLILLPFRLAFFVVKLAGLAVVGAVGLAVVLVAAVLGVVGLALAVFVPLLPLALVAGGIWLLIRANRRPVVT